ncbi:hypothetical protein EJC51_24330 [Streptomyces aquilus]|uniref:Uncharacterized protein n=1 Tax=Streptomyces aquilus TaxID=2548456 RepID=A0A3S9I3H0_9ACTN|nr:hypothetical protein EJC51_24330 [Streptomyces aquilus]
MGGGQSWRAHHRTGFTAAVRQVHKMTYESYDRKITFWCEPAPHTPSNAPYASPIWAASRRQCAYTRARAAIRNGMSSRGREAGA